MTTGRLTEARAVTVRLRTLLTVVTAVLVASGIVITARWVTGLQPLEAGNGAWGARGLTALRHTDDALDTGPLGVQNTSSVPVTISGVAGALGGRRGGAIAGPRLALPASLTIGSLRRFHPVRLGGGARAMIALVYSTNPAICRLAGHLVGVETAGVATLRFELPGGLGETQTITLPQPFVLREPSRADCERAS